VEEIRELGRNTQGVTVIKLGAGEKVVGVDRIPYLEGEESEDDGENNSAEHEQGDQEDDTHS
jgi:DNA gyrase subunit A